MTACLNDRERASRRKSRSRWKGGVAGASRVDVQARAPSGGVGDLGATERTGTHAAPTIATARTGSDNDLSNRVSRHNVNLRCGQREALARHFTSDVDDVRGAPRLRCLWARIDSPRDCRKLHRPSPVRPRGARGGAQAPRHVHRHHGLRGLMHCLWEVIDNSVDEALGGYGRGSRSSSTRTTPSRCATTAAASPWTSSPRPG